MAMLLAALWCDTSCGAEPLAVATSGDGLDTYSMPPIVVYGTTPVDGAGLDPSKLPANVHRLDAADLQRGATAPSLADGIDRTHGSAALADSEGNPFQSSLSLRGFTVSPILGEPQGVAVYQDGMRLNEPFGDVVLWDLVPTFALERAEIIPGADPSFGLNALGGALSLRSKSGFTFEGMSANASGGSFGRADATVEAGGHRGSFAVYGGLRGFREDGWRDHSASRLGQLFLAAGYSRDELELGATFAAAASDLHGNGATPVDLLHRDRDAVFTFPDRVRDRGSALVLRGAWSPAGVFSLQGVTSYRYVDQRRSSGDVGDFGACTMAASPDTLCIDPGSDETIVVDRDGGAVATPLGAPAIVNRSDVSSHAVGATERRTGFRPRRSSRARIQPSRADFRAPSSPTRRCGRSSLAVSRSAYVGRAARGTTAGHWIGRWRRSARATSTTSCSLPPVS